MCVLLCANPQVYRWLDVVGARASRDGLQLSPLCPGDPLTYAEIEETEYLEEVDVHKLARGPMLRRPAWSRGDADAYLRDATRNVSLHEWKHPLDAIANALSRLLVLVGWRR